MLEDAPFQIIRDADIKNASMPIGKDVDIVLSHGVKYQVGVLLWGGAYGLCKEYMTN